MSVSEVIYSTDLANFGMKRTHKNYLKGNKKPTESNHQKDLYIRPLFI